MTPDERKAALQKLVKFYANQGTFSTSSLAFRLMVNWYKTMSVADLTYRANIAVNYFNDFAEADGQMVKTAIVQDRVFVLYACFLSQTTDFYDMTDNEIQALLETMEEKINE